MPFSGLDTLVEIALVVLLGVRLDWLKSKFEKKIILFSQSFETTKKLNDREPDPKYTDIIYKQQIDVVAEALSNFEKDVNWHKNRSQFLIFALGIWVCGQPMLHHVLDVNIPDGGGIHYVVYIASCSGILWACYISLALPHKHLNKFEEEIVNMMKYLDRFLRDDIKSLDDTNP